MIERYLIGAVVGLAALIGAFFYGVGVGRDREIADGANARAEAEKQVERKQATIDSLRADAADRESIRETTVREIYRDIPKIIERPVYRNICVDTDGVQLLDRAVAAANGEDRPGAAGKPGAATKDAAKR